MRLGLSLAALALIVGIIFSAGREHALTRSELVNERLRRNAAETALERAAVAAAVHRAHIARMQQERRRFQHIRNELQQMEGRDAPLSPLLCATAERLYGSR